MDSPKFYKAQRWSKKTLRTSSFLHAWRGSKRTMRTSGGGLISSNCYKPPWRYSKRTLQTPTCLAAVKTDSPNFYKPPTRLAVVKTDYLNFPNITTDSVLLTNTLESGKKKKYGLNECLQAYCTLDGSGQNRLAKLLQAFAVVKRNSPSLIWVGSNRLSEVLTRSVVVKIYSQNFYKPPKCLAKV